MSRRRRILALIAALLAVVLVGVGVWAAFLRDRSSGEAGPSATKIEVMPGQVFSDTIGVPAAFPDDQRDLLVKKVRNYVETATVQPLRSGDPADGLGSLFDPGALSSLQGVDGNVMLDQGLPEVTGKLTAVSEPVVIYALADASGAWVMASAQVTLDVKGGLDDGTIRIRRKGELLFVPAAGDWKITAYDMFVEREGPGVEDKGGKTK